MCVCTFCNHSEVILEDYCGITDAQGPECGDGTEQGSLGGT